MIREAAGSAIIAKGNYFGGKFSHAVGGIVVAGYFSGDGKTIMTAFPVYVP